MGPEGRITSERIRSVADELTRKVPRSRLQECLVEARLFSKNTGRDDLRKVASTPRGWADFVFEKFQTPATRSAALRALALLSEAYVKLPELDSRVDSAFHKAHQAAERGDITRLQREVSKLRALSAELDSPELLNAGVILWMWAGTPSARDRVSEFLNGVADSNGEPPPSESHESPTLITQAPVSSVPQPVHPQPQESSAHRVPAAPAFLTELASLGAPRPVVELPDWKLDDARSLVRFPPE
jgi:hypothetical protein